MKNIILGTDWWTDCDDAVAMRIVTHFARSGEINLLGVAINACMEYSVASVKGFLRADGFCDVPVGIDRDATDFEGRLCDYQKNLALKFAADVRNDDALDAVRLYRELLVKAEGKVDIIEIGFLQVVSALLESEADDISDKTGIELVREKVSKFWVMAGKWDGDGEKEHNFCNNERSRHASEIFCRKCPVPVTFLGFEVGHKVITGTGLDENDHLYGVLCDHGSRNGRHSWDPMLVLLAIIGDEEQAGYDTVVGKATVDGNTGANYFKPDPTGLHKYVIKKYANEYYEKRINEIIGT